MEKPSSCRKNPFLGARQNHSLKLPLIWIGLLNLTKHTNRAVYQLRLQSKKSTKSSPSEDGLSNARHSATRIISREQAHTFYPTPR